MMLFAKIIFRDLAKRFYAFDPEILSLGIPNKTFLDSIRF